MSKSFRHTLDIDWLQANGEHIRIHGNGFIQIDIAPGTRLHIHGHPGVPRQQRPTPIHDHRFGFISTVYSGALVNVDYEFITRDDLVHRHTHQVCHFEPSGKSEHDTVLTPTGVTGHLSRIGMRLIRPDGRPYFVDPAEFHETFANEPTVTIMSKMGVRANHAPRVLTQIGVAPDNSFDRATMIPESRAWEIVEDTLRYVAC